MTQSFAYILVIVFAKSRECATNTLQVSPLHFRDLELGTHMLRVNGTLVRIGAALQGPRIPSVVNPTGGLSDTADAGSTLGEHDGVSTAAPAVVVSSSAAAKTITVFSEANEAESVDVFDTEELMRSKAAAYAKRTSKARRRASFTPKPLPKRPGDDEYATGAASSDALHCMLVDRLQVRRSWNLSFHSCDHHLHYRHYHHHHHNHNHQAE